jgi:hypothetical protein
MTWDKNWEKVFINGRIGSEGYRNLLDEHLSNIRSIMGPKNWIFQRMGKT